MFLNIASLWLAVRLNFNPDFKQLRNEVTRYMMALDEEAKKLAQTQQLPLPDLQPVMPGVRLGVA